MAGHNKWSKIKRKKEVADQAKSKVFGKLARDIAIAVRESGGDEESPSVRALVDKARAENMPKDNVKRALSRGKGTAGGSLESVVFEAYGPAGVGIIISGTTDNNNRTSQEIKGILSKFNITLASPGSASWAFEKNEGEWVATTTIDISEEEREKLAEIVSALEEYDDIDGVYTNVNGDL